MTISSPQQNTQPSSSATSSPIEQEQQLHQTPLSNIISGESSNAEEPRRNRVRTRSQSRNEDSALLASKTKSTTVKRTKKSPKKERIKRRKPVKEEFIYDDIE